MEKENKWNIIKEKRLPLIIISFAVIIILISIIMMIMSKKDTQAENKKETGNSIKAYEVIREGSVLDNIASKYVASSEGINFAEAPGDENGKGIYIRSGTENNQYPIYYYRGEVTNNNVIFADFCWKIVRTTETGGIKLIYNGIPSDGKCNNTNEASQIGKSKFNDKDDDNAYVGYMYGTPNSNTYEETHDNINNSTIKMYIDEWYKKNIEDKGYSKKIEDTIWCNDRSLSSENIGIGTGSLKTTYASNQRLNSYKIIPVLSCKNNNDNFTVNKSNGNGALTYPVALLTADETTLAGIGFKGYSDISYLYTGIPFMLMTPSMFLANYARTYQTHSSLWVAPIASTAGVRPAISLKNDTEFINGGDGTTNNPYVVK